MAHTHMRARIPSLLGTSLIDVLTSTSDCHLNCTVAPCQPFSICCHPDVEPDALVESSEGEGWLVGWTRLHGSSWWHTPLRSRVPHTVGYIRVVDCCPGHRQGGSAVLHCWCDRYTQHTGQARLVLHILWNSMPCVIVEKTRTWTSAIGGYI